ncbi:uncharacterized protein LOC110110931 [Dendrobium catenatum]|uniref:uncharacterized protein LOC110110931 n=1 Tax=Dendrobium catenatum TaxID=906689 RepID=UPI0009F4CB3E|nr:uncharacterized protein LOC110110931 [Dendrobium catenatum]
MITGTVLVGNHSLFQIYVIYASNSASDRKDLWTSISMVAPSIDTPWGIIGDFNCCHFATEKFGGSAHHHSALVDINNMIFTNGLVDLHSVGFYYTWFNQRTENPIFIKLDRALVNEEWMKKFPNAYYSFQSPSCSDHSLIILHPSVSFHSHHRFLFKNFWIKHDRYWTHLLKASMPMIGNPLSHLCNVLRHLKGDIKNEHWANSHTINMQLDSLHAKQLDLLELIQATPTDASLCASLKDTNLKISEVSSTLASWIIQRAKINWLYHGEDDLKFLNAKIRSRMGSTKYVVNLFARNPNIAREEVLQSILMYFQDMFNPPPTCMNMDFFPIGVFLSDNHANLLITPILDDEIRAAVFKGSSKSAPGPDGFNYHFYKSG